MTDANLFYLFCEMEDIRILVRCGGHWKGNIYNNSYPEMIFMPRNLTYETLLVIVHEIVCVYLNSCAYELRFRLNTNGKIARFRIKNDKDVQYVLGKGNRILKVYVTDQHFQ